MTLALLRAEFFVRDFDLQFRRYLDEANGRIAERYFAALEATLEQLTRHPALGRIRRFDHRELKGIRSYRVHPPRVWHPARTSEDTQTQEDSFQKTRHREYSSA